MSQLRRRLYEFQKERIELIAQDASQRRGDEPFVILVLDLNDPFARDIAIAKSSHADVDRQIGAAESKDVSPCLLLDTTEDDANVLFETSPGWDKLRSTAIRTGIVRVILVGDGGVTFLTHRMPT